MSLECSVQRLRCLCAHHAELLFKKFLYLECNCSTENRGFSAFGACSSSKLTYEIMNPSINTSGLLSQGNTTVKDADTHLSHKQDSNPDWGKSRIASVGIQTGYLTNKGLERYQWTKLLDNQAISAVTLIAVVDSYCSHCFDGLRLNPCGTSAANGSILQPPDDTWVNVEQRWNYIDREIEGLGKEPGPVPLCPK
jgi:hypothetical protein